jgi:uncharacterized protein with von Willebrand factor type A (vWA) domain
MAREILFELGKMITDRLPYKFGIKKLTEEDPEYILLDRSLESDEQAEIMLKMGLRQPKTLEEIAKITGKDPKHVEELLEKAAVTGAVEYHRENPEHKKLYYVQLFVPGIAEMTNMVRWQFDKYPEIGEVARRMGRTVEEEGRDHISVQSGFHFKIDHSSGSDIEGITVGNDINALLPMELTQYADEQLEDLFYKKFLTRRLQTFRYRSELNKPAQKLHKQRAVRRGPMIVCLDSSASMYGVPQKIMLSLLGKLEQTAEELQRDCFLIDFSVSIRPIDLRARLRNRLMERIGQKPEKGSECVQGEFPFIGGGTDAEKMLRLTFALLDDGGNRYMNADVLWVTDFLIPRTTQELMERFQEYKESGTRFYGFQIGEGENNWEKYFDHIYRIHYVRPRMY